MPHIGMSPGSPSFLDRLSPTRHGAPLLPLHRKRDNVRSVYNLEELDPQPTDGLLSPQSPKPIERPRRASNTSTYRDDASQTTSPKSPSRNRRSKVAFAGIPPSVVAPSVPMNQEREASPPPEAPSRNLAPHNVASSLINIGSVFFDQRPKTQPAYNANPDSIWLNLKRRETAIEDELQQMLDMQSAALTGGLGNGVGIVATDQDTFSDTGSSTPTGTSYYSTVTSRSKLSRSLVEPTQSTSRGDVIPVRQPKRSKPLGIRAARRGLLKAMVGLGDLKAEEDARVNSAISQRKTALARLRTMSGRQKKITSELRVLQADDEEPLGKELRELEANRGALTDEIKELEERLVGLRNKRRWVDGRIHDVRNRREAGLSGYKGALKEVEAEVDALMRRPPVKPLDREFWRGVYLNGIEGDDDMSPGGEEFMSLIPERRTLEMAKIWWETEIKALEKRRREVDKNREALEKGEEVWRETVDLVTDYETGLRKLMHLDGQAIATGNGKGKEKAVGRGNTVQQLLRSLSTVTSSLEQKLQIAEENSWNLLICAIGAELEAFREAERLLRSGLGEVAQPDSMLEDVTPTADREESATSMESPVFKPSTPMAGIPREESDNEVPHDLLSSPPDEEYIAPREPSPVKKTLASPLDHMPPLERSDSENSVPPEFLAEHPRDDDGVN